MNEKIIRIKALVKKEFLSIFKDPITNTYGIK